MKRITLIALLVIFAGCSPRHYYGCGFLANPDFDKFGASFSHEGGLYAIKSYIQSKMMFRTEYIYENFDITLPDTLVPGREYRIDEPGVKFRYAKGGQAGQLETVKAKGTFTIKKVNADGMVLDLSLAFFDFKKIEWPLEVPQQVLRKGTLSAVKGYKLY